ncbi:sulfatase-like hydrolase/transferase [Parenemella sanctibonifatiensis]|uniref:Sulfatase N-terminal domain-containing protein n=1 Tax=Parenemella sanctibonifatiensis TaxID=2016505 RepID=A0A255ED78_9ACTN|nr:sulfatase-like hydrolase/transferase [Parenemella sanctibonifatiensis]OYN89518.1 hypothetical protein CGZ91_11575 [Parenemella sanctibonifatiensis]
MRPNVVIFMTDQQRGATLDPGHRLRALTPNVDAMAADGVRFSRAYAPSPRCCPARTSFMTGRHPIEHGVWNNVNVANALSRGPRPGTPFWSRDLASAGYALGFAGKWHVSNTENPWIRARADQDQPWVSYIGPLGPHDPYQPPQEFLDQYDPDAIHLEDSFADPMTDKPALYRRIRDRFDQLTEPEHREALRHYLAFCSYEDALFGEVVAAVAESGQLDDTIFIYLSDHGDYAGDHGLWCKGLPAFTSAYHVPLVIGGRPIQAANRGGVVDAAVSLMDIGPTLLELCGAELAHPMSGRSLVPALTGEPIAERDLLLATEGNETYGNQRILLAGDWKLVVNMFDRDELYHLATDPGEMKNLLHRGDEPRAVGVPEETRVPEELRAVVEDLYARLWRLAVGYGDDLTNGYILTALGQYGPGVAASPRP